LSLEFANFFTKGCFVFNCIYYYCYWLEHIHAQAQMVIIVLPGSNAYRSDAASPTVGKQSNGHRNATQIIIAPVTHFWHTCWHSPTHLTHPENHWNFLRVLWRKYKSQMFETIILRLNMANYFIIKFWICLMLQWSLLVDKHSSMPIRKKK
jgi:hypothetical protein